MQPEFETVLIDGDPMVYAIAAVTEEEPLSYALSTTKRAVRNVQEAAGAQGYDLYIQGPGNFRDSLAVSNSYKAGRATKKPKHFAAVREYMQEYLGGSVVSGYETDDMVSFLLWEDYERAHGDPEKCSRVLASTDKDLMNTPGWHMSTKRGAKDPHFVTDMESTEHFWYQMLAGDTVDTIKGLPGISEEISQKYEIGRGGCGPSRANALLSKVDPDDLEAAVYEAYLSWSLEKDLTPELAYEYFREQGQLLWMTREFRGDGSPVLWEPGVAPPTGYRTGD